MPPPPPEPLPELPDIAIYIEALEARIVDDSGTALRPGEVGELWVRGGLVMKGYYRDPEHTAKVLTPEGWLKTGDLARFSEDGNLYIVGRLKELIIRSGFNVYPAEVEGAIAEHPDIALAAVIGCPANGNEDVVAFVQPRPGATPDPEDLAAFAAARLAAYKRPAAFLIRADQQAGFPVGKSGARHLGHGRRVPDGRRVEPCRGAAPG